MQRGRERFHLLTDEGATFGKVRHDSAIIGQGIGVIPHRFQRKLSGCVKPMSTGGQACIHIQQATRDQIVAVPQKQPMDGPHELGIAGAPAHTLRDG